jgi:radical SAM superfamily enzyme YgiQ (UPF0313 family)
VCIDGRVHVNPPREKLKELDDLPFPDFDCIDLSEYAGRVSVGWQDLSRTVGIMMSRGCPYGCFYCHDIFGKKVRRRSAANLIAEMRQHIEKRGIRDFSFVDDLFNVPADPAKQALRAIAKELPPVRLSFPNGLRADQIDDEMVDLFEAAGTVFMSLAVESGNARMQKLIGKRLRLDKAKHAIRRCSERFVVMGFFMVGFPTETYSEALDTLAFAEDIKTMAYPDLFVVRVYEGTPLWSFLSPDADQARRLVSQQSANYAPKMSSRELDFYGDVFGRDKVPMTGGEIQRFRWEWLKRVRYAEERLPHRDRLLRKHWTADELAAMAKYVIPPVTGVAVRGDGRRATPPSSPTP